MPEPPYAKLTNNSDTEEGYETIPQNHRPHPDPGYEVVPNKAPGDGYNRIDPGYETVPAAGHFETDR